MAILSRIKDYHEQCLVDKMAFGIVAGYLQRKVIFSGKLSLCMKWAIIMSVRMFSAVEGHLQWKGIIIHIVGYHHVSGDVQCSGGLS